jgi:DNA-binding MarR family transcriptional regulator
MFFDENTEPLERRLGVGLQKLGMAMKQQGWSRANEIGLSPTQAQILSALVDRPVLSGSELASELGLSLPTISDSTRALIEKGLVEKQPDPRHPRASLVSLTAKGARTATTVRQWPDFMMSALRDLSAEEHAGLLRVVIKMIRGLQRDGFIPVERMCVSCRYFQPRVHDGPKPHHCAFVDAPLAEQQLRLDCPEHERAPEERLAATWEAFAKN